MKDAKLPWLVTALFVLSQAVSAQLSGAHMSYHWYYWSLQHAYADKPVPHGRSAAGMFGFPFEYPKWFSDYIDVLQEHGAERVYLLHYIQEWNENMQLGIKRLNMHPQSAGVTPVNGALLINESDASIPGRLGDFISVVRYYDSKIWFADTSGGQRNDTLRYAFYVGLGWDFHFGRLWPDSNDARIYEAPNGLRFYFKDKGSSEYMTTDGSFMRLRGDTIRTPDGIQLIFGHYDDGNSTGSDYLTKIIDRDGNITSLYYDTYCFVDSIKTSTNEKLIFHYRDVSIQPYAVIDTIKYIGYDNSTLNIVYNYDSVTTDSSPFGAFDTSAILLKSVTYPNGESTYYDYNGYFELTGIHTSRGGLVKYVYTTDTFFIPKRTCYPRMTRPIRFCN